MILASFADREIDTPGHQALNRFMDFTGPPQGPPDIRQLIAPPKRQVTNQTTSVIFAGNLGDGIADAAVGVEVNKQSLVVTKKSRVVEGRIEREDDAGIEIRTSDFLSGPVRIKKTDILERRPSKNSTMPTGLLDTLEKGEVPDLVGYLLSRAKTGSESGK